MWEGKQKAVTFSYDDGILQDQRLIELFDYYHVKGTFNLNSGIQSNANSFNKNGITIKRRNIDEIRHLYQGHEIAVHCLTHANLPDYNAATIRNEVFMDKNNLQQISGYEINGMAYPYGCYNDLVVNIVKECGLRYARTIESSREFSIPGDLFRFRPTCHHNDPEISNLVDKFIHTQSNEPQLFYIWGHSYEFDIDQNWNHIENILDKLSGHKDVYYGTNSQVLLI